MCCSFCKRFRPNGANKFVTGCSSIRLDNIRSHEKSVDHKFSNTANSNEHKKETDRPILKAINNLEHSEMDFMRKMFRTAFFLAKEEKPFTDFKKINELQSANFQDSRPGKCFIKVSNHYNNDKQAKTFINFIAEAERENQLELIRKSEFLSAAMDGSTDSSNLEEESHFLSFFDENYEPHVEFVKIYSVEGRATADNLTKSFYELYSGLGVDIEHSCVQLVTDGPTVMKKMCSQVQERIQWVVPFHCMNHRLELAFKDSVKNLPLETETYTLLDGLHGFYKNSSLQWRNLKSSCDVLGISCLVHPPAKGTRWLAHRERAVLALARNYEANLAQLRACHLDRTQKNETKLKALGLAEKLQNKDIVLFLFVTLKILLVSFACLSSILQADNLSIDTIIGTVKKTKAKLENFDCELEIEKFQNENITEGDIFRNIVLKQKRTGGRGISSDPVVTQSKMLIENLKSAMADRLGPMNEGNSGLCPILAKFSIFDVSSLPVDKHDNLNEYGKEEIKDLANHFSEILVLKGYDVNAITDKRVSLWEYAKQLLKTTLPEGRTIKTFWPKVLRQKANSVELKNILALVKILLVLIFSTECVERSFSLMNRVKCDWRASLSSGSLNNLMLVANSQKTVENFNPDPAIKLWLASSKSKLRLVSKYGERKHSSDSSSSKNTNQTSDSDNDSMPELIGYL